MMITLIAAIVLAASLDATQADALEAGAGEWLEYFCNGSDVVCLHESMLHQKRLAVTLRERLRNFSDGIHLPPITQRDERVTVLARLVTVDVGNINQEDNSFASTHWFGVWWRSPLLRWRPADFGNMTSVTLQFDQRDMWFPDFAYNNARGQIDRALFFDNYPIVYHTGTVVWWHLINSKYSCRLTYVNYPFDKHVCIVSVQFANYYTEQQWELDCLNITLQDYFAEDTMWRLIGHRVDHYSGDEYSGGRMSFQFLLSRKPAYEILTIVAPTIMLSIAGIAIFLTPIRCPVRLQMGLTHLLSFFVLFSFLIDTIPVGDPETGISIFAIYVFMQFIGSMVSVVFTALIERMSVGRRQRLRRKSFIKVVQMPGTGGDESAGSNSHGAPNQSRLLHQESLENGNRANSMREVQLSTRFQLYYPNLVGGVVYSLYSGGSLLYLWFSIWLNDSDRDEKLPWIAPNKIQTSVNETQCKHAEWAPFNSILPITK